MKPIETRQCPKCGQTERQIKAGFNRSGTQRCVCRDCKNKYTPSGKKRELPDEIKQQAIKTYYSGARGVGIIFGMGKENVLRWIKKNESGVDKWENKH